MYEKDKKNTFNVQEVCGNYLVQRMDYTVR